MNEFSKVLELGNRVLSSVDEGLVELAATYNAELDKLVKEFSTVGSELQDTQREVAAAVMEQHAKIVSRMEVARDMVGSQLVEAQKKTQAIRSYFEQRAPRGGFTGTRKG